MDLCLGLQQLNDHSGIVMNIEFHKDLSDVVARYTPIEVIRKYIIIPMNHLRCFALLYACVPQAGLLHCFTLLHACVPRSGPLNCFILLHACVPQDGLLHCFTLFHACVPRAGLHHLFTLLHLVCHRLDYSFALLCFMHVWHGLKNKCVDCIAVVFECSFNIFAFILLSFSLLF